MNRRYPVEFSEEAEDDAEKISEYLDTQLANLGFRFLENLQEGAITLSKNPEGFHFFNSQKKIRRFNLTRFSYAVYYLVSKDNRVKILAVTHIRRSNNYLKRRLR